MIRFILLLCTGLMILQAAESVAAPVIRFTDLEWWGRNEFGGSGWWAGRDQTDYPTTMGKIDEPRINGRQEMIWERGNYEIESVKRENDRVFIVVFAKGSLRLSHMGGRRWQVEFTQRGREQPERIFRTDRPAPAGSLDTPDSVR